MKGQIIGYAAIIAILIAAVISISYSTLSNNSSENVTTTEGPLVSSEDFNFFFLKTLNQSIEFIAQRAAYDLALNGGFIENRETAWSYSYPQISDLRKNLENAIESTLPSSYKNFDKIVELENTNITIDEQTPLSASEYFNVTGYTNISIYDETVNSKTYSNFNINSRAVSSYFKLLYAGREILENSSYSLLLATGDFNQLKSKILSDFDVISSIDVSGDYSIISLTDNCLLNNQYYCLAPLRADEPLTTYGSINISYAPINLTFRVYNPGLGGILEVYANDSVSGSGLAANVSVVPEKFNPNADFNLDNYVNLEDMVMFSGYYGQTVLGLPGGTAPKKFDLNDNGKIDIGDLVILAKAFGYKVSNYTTYFKIIVLPGNYTLNAVYNTYPTKTQSVTINNIETTTVKFSFP